MMQPQAWDIPHLVVLSPSAQRGRRIDLYKDYTVVGRGQDCDDDPDVSRAHAALHRQGATVSLQDLGTRYDIGQQRAATIRNVGGDQYNSYIQHIVEQREDFLRAVAATKTKARWLVWIGFIFFVVGFALFASTAIGFLKQVSSEIQSENPTPPSNPFGAEVYGIPLGLLGWALSAIGIFVLIIGIVLHIVATSRRRRVDRDYPMPAGWAQYR